MKDNTADRRIRKTTHAIKKALMEQMLVRKYNELSVSGICEAADISRRTFYLHYQDIDDVFRHIFDEINTPLYRGMEELEQLYGHGENEEYELAEIFRLINETIENNTAYLTRISIEPSYGAIQLKHILLMKDLIKTHLKHTESGSSMHSVYLDYYISGILELYFQWYRHDHDLSLNEIRDFAMDMFRAEKKYFSRNAEEPA